MDNCEEECDIDIDIETMDSDEEEHVGEKCISLLASLLPSNQPTSLNLISTAISLELESSEDEKTETGESQQQQQQIVEMDQIMDTYDFPDPYPVQVRARPQVPPKPPIDTVRYSMNNIKESADWQLDELLEELEALEHQLNTSNGGDQLLLGVSGIPQSTSREPVHLATKPPPPQPPTVFHHPPPPQPHHHQISSNGSSCSSPDGDSAFGDSSSTESHRCRNSAFSSNESCRDSLNTPSPTQVSPRNGEMTAEELKALKIKQALEKMKEAKVTRIFVKFFVEDGPPLQMLIDERWTVADTMKQLAEKNQIALMEDHCIVEEFPDLYIRRIFEDHEKVVENIQLWQQDSLNKLYFMRRPDKYTFIDRPELYLVTEKTSDYMEIPEGNNWTMDTKQGFIREYFGRDPVMPPEMEGFLYLKSDGRKSWKKHYFVLRPSGLYYSPKGKKSTKDLACLMNLHSNQVYQGINWEKKYKSPTPWCISIKLTALQIKRSQFIKYICAEDEMMFKKWMVALRIAKNGGELLNNFEKACQIRRETLGGGMSAASSSIAISPPSTASSTLHLNGFMSNNAPKPLCVNVRNNSSFSVASSQPSHPSPISRVVDFDEQPTGTIKRAPIDVLRRVSRTSTSSGTPTIPQEEEDSDEDDFPAPPPIVCTPSRITPIQQQPPMTPPKPSTTMAPSTNNTPTPKKCPPPPPPKRADTTRLQSSTPTPPSHHMVTDLEAALAKRREKMGGACV